MAMAAIAGLLIPRPLHGKPITNLLASKAS
jgi:hypothetical protein